MFTTLGPALTAPLYLFFFEQARGYTPAQANWLLMLYIGAGFVGPVFWARMAVRMTKHGTIMIGAVAYSIAQTILLLLPAAHPLEMSVAMFAVGFIASGFPLVVRAMIADVTDEVRLDTGHDRTALLYSITTSVAKVGSTLSVGIAYSILPLFGFVAAAGTVNTPEAIWGLEACYLVPPVLCVMIGGLAMWGYKLDAKRHGEIRAALDAQALVARAEGAIEGGDFSGDLADPTPAPGA
jgi:Na+/melibiose symporter-like transporter